MRQLGGQAGNDIAKYAIVKTIGFTRLEGGNVLQKFTAELKRTVWTRDGSRCVKCGVMVEQGDIHHRVARGMGSGNRAEWVNQHENLLTLCRRCHDWIEEHRDESREHGWLVSLEHGRTPTDVLVHYHDGWVYRLHGDFFLTPVDLWRGQDVRSLVA